MGSGIIVSDEKLYYPASLAVKCDQWGIRSNHWTEPLTKPSCPSPLSSGFLPGTQKHWL